MTKAEVESEPQESLPIFKPLLTESKHADVVLECGGRKFHCHKAVLSLRSPVLDRMLEVDMEEAAQGCIVIKDMEAEVLEKVLEYVYTGEVEEVGDRLAELLYAGDKYQLTGLVSLSITTSPEPRCTSVPAASRRTSPRRMPWMCWCSPTGTVSPGSNRCWCKPSGNRLYEQI